MKISVISVGQMKTGPEFALFNRYIRRLPWKITIKEVEEKRNLPLEKLKETEADLLFKVIPEKAIKIALDENGKILSSREFSQKIAMWRDTDNDLAFIIGGANGLSRNVLDNVDYILSLGKMTWPHMLARVMLSEQLYRAHTILTSHPYHK